MMHPDDLPPRDDLSPHDALSPHHLPRNAYESPRVDRLGTLAELTQGTRGVLEREAPSLTLPSGIP
ncbi:lasso RiPP family leader peptide-containing protein [Pengzhenrongella sicca]|uniref:Lasso RiPP family leader peptide-containing protein n=1 Tax=Pengzhenrongella sicca TaxID=2819238 RepID=A0A8A4ZFW6_9MICO|nr:lasso RiPP family leader peptide-containing protein [Pengzhenrongella sicca]QTE29426.1 lasso RiPP family leader peptide-containing protein [Pengzhenrongella sicca]